MNRICLALIFFFSIVSYSQQAKMDSLTTLFNVSKSDTTRIRLLKDIGVAAYFTDGKVARKINDSLINYSKALQNKEYLARGYRMGGTLDLLDGNYEDSEKNYLESLSIFKEMNNEKYESILYGNLATLYGRQRDVEKAIEYFKKSIDLNIKIGENFNNMNSFLNLGILASKAGNLHTATDYYINALEIAENKNSYHYIAYTNNSLANIYLKLLRFDKAEQHINDALKAGEKEENKYSLGETHNLFGWLYDARDDDNKTALIHYKQALSNYSDINNKTGMLTNNYTVGRQLVFLKQYDEAQSYLETGLALADSLKIDESIIIGNFELGYLYVHKGDFKKAETYLNPLKLHFKNTSKIELKNHYARIGRAYENHKKYDLAYEYLETYTSLTDSLFQENGVDRIADIETKYQTEKKEKEYSQLALEKAEQELELERENKHTWFFAIGLLVSLLTLAVFGYFYQRNKKQKLIIENLQKDLHHRVKNNLIIIDSLIDDIKDEFNNKSFTSKLTDLQNRIDSINEVHKQLYMNTDITHLKLKNYVEKLAHNVEQSFSNKNITIQQNINNSLTLDPDKSFPVGLIINEFLTNSFKYAFNDNEQGIININITENPQNYLLSLSDNGKGLPIDFDISKLDSFGIDIMQLLSKQLNGTFSLNSNNGVKLDIEFPKT